MDVLYSLYLHLNHLNINISNRNLINYKLQFVRESAPLKYDIY